MLVELWVILSSCLWYSCTDWLVCQIPYQCLFLSRKSRHIHPQYSITAALYQEHKATTVVVNMVLRYGENAIIHTCSTNETRSSKTTWSCFWLQNLRHDNSSQRFAGDRRNREPRDWLRIVVDNDEYVVKEKTTFYAQLERLQIRIFHFSSTRYFRLTIVGQYQELLVLNWSSQAAHRQMTVTNLAIGHGSV